MHLEQNKKIYEIRKCHENSPTEEYVVEVSRKPADPGTVQPEYDAMEEAVLVLSETKRVRVCAAHSHVGFSRSSSPDWELVVLTRVGRS